MSKRFQFPLQKVLEYRESKKNSEASKLSRSKEKLALEQNKQQQFEIEKNKAIQNDAVEEMESIHHLKVSSDYIVQLNDNLEKQGKIVKNTEDIVEIDNQMLLDAMKDQKVVEILLGKQEYLFYREKKKKELKFHDEQATRISYQKHRNSP